MGVEFRLGGQDHKKVEDFLAGQPGGVSAIVLDTKAARHQQAAAESAAEAGVAVYFDPTVPEAVRATYAPMLDALPLVERREGPWFRDGRPCEYHLLSLEPNAPALAVATGRSRALE